ncbi:hypothetical protein F4823DRAFT_563346 [Ustulina deusta]|nr:hypothetical protein F4823DRAFT_563346 [Ustulina deusta]
MVSLSDIIASNDRILLAPLASLVAVFVGGPNGVGEYTLNAFSKYAPAPKIQEKMAVVNVLVKSPGSMAFQSETDEGLPVLLALGTHSRLRSIVNLLTFRGTARGTRMFRWMSCRSRYAGGWLVGGRKAAHTP